MIKLQRKKDWVGHRVRLLVPLETKGGTVYPVGTEMMVMRNHGGLHLRMLKMSEHCGVGRYDIIRSVPERDVEIID